MLVIEAQEYAIGLSQSSIEGLSDSVDIGEVVQITSDIQAAARLVALQHDLEPHPHLEHVESHASIRERIIDGTQGLL